MTRLLPLALLAALTLCIPACAPKNDQKPVEEKKEPVYTPPARSNEPVYSDPAQQPAPETTKTTEFPPSNDSAQPDETLTPKKPAKSKTQSTAGGRTYVVKKGDTLSEIAKKFYGDSTQWKKIYNANKSRIKDPKKLQVGTKLVIP